MSNFAQSSIHNGADCKSYCWSQSHSDIEIQIKLSKVARYEDIDVIVSPDSIKVELKDQIRKEGGIFTSFIRSNDYVIKTLMSGDFEHPVYTDSLCWLLDNNPPSVLIYIDKSEDMWWTQLLKNEEVKSFGPKNYVVSMDEMEDGSRMVIDKLIVDQRNKKIKKDRHLPPV